MSNRAAESNSPQPSSDATTTAKTTGYRAPSLVRRAANTAFWKIAGNRPDRTYQMPRPTLWFVIRRTWGRVFAMQVWDLAATMTFYLVLSLLPGLIALTSILTLIDFTEETIWTIAGLVNDLIPALETTTVVATLLSLIDTPGGVTALTLGLIGSLYSASNVVAAFHRAMNRLYDTREGRPFIYFRFVVFVETLVLLIASLALVLFIVLGGDFSVRLGEAFGLTQETVATWNLLKWPLIQVGS